MAGTCYPSLMECQLCLLDQREETGSSHIAREKEKYIPIVGRIYKYILCHPKVEVTHPYRSPPTHKSSPLPHLLVMASNDECSTIVPDNGPSSLTYNDDAWLLEVARIQVLHEATLQDLLGTTNDAVIHLLHERNELLWER